LADEDLLAERPTGLAWFMDVLRTWGPAIFAVLLIRTYVFEPFRIPSGSMLPTLQIGDHVVVNKMSYGLWVPYILVDIPFLETVWATPRVEVADFGDPERGDIIVFRYPKNESLNYIKRVVAIPGDTISVRNNQIILNGEPQDRTYIDRYTYLGDRCDEMRAKRYVEDLDGLEHEVLTNAGVPGYLATMREITVPEDSVFVMGDNRDNSEDSRRWKFVRFDQIKGKAHIVWFSWATCSQSVRGDRFFESLYTMPEHKPSGSD